MKKIKVAMIGLRGIPAKSGGVENTVENLAPLLVKLGADVTVYCRMPYCEERPHLFKGVKLKYLPTLNTKYTETFIHTTISTADALFRDFDIVHYHAMGNSMFSILPRLAGKKTVLTLHGLDWEREKWGFLAKQYLKFNERLSVSFPNRVISVSSKIKEYYGNRYSKDITFIPNGVKVNYPEPISILNRFALKKDGYILFLSRIVPEKGLHFLIDAFKGLNTKLRLVIVGDATHTEEYLNEMKESARGDPRIIFTGPLYGIEKAAVFSNARLFVLPSTIEGMPVVLLEAMSFGICSLVSDIKENRDVIGDGGFIFKSKSSSDLRSKLKFILSHPALAKQKSERGKRRVDEEFRWDSIATRTLQVYKELVR